MKFSRSLALVSLIAILSGGIIAFYQNCSEVGFGTVGAKVQGPISDGTAAANGPVVLCQSCSDNTGSGVSCRADETSPFGSCQFESCRSGFRLQDKSCVPVSCGAGTSAACAVEHGDGRMACNENGSGYGPCVPISCDAGFEIVNGICVAVVPGPVPAPTPAPTGDPAASPLPPPAPAPGPAGEPAPAPTPPPAPAPAPGPAGEPAPAPAPPPPAPICVPGTHRDCSTDSQIGVETCNDSGTDFSACILNECKPGYRTSGIGQCEPDICKPGAVTGCTSGAGVGFQTCNSQGSGWGVCEITGCQQGFSLVDGVCVVQTCSPGSEVVCEVRHGSGSKVCNAQGTDYGPCKVEGCLPGYSHEDGECREQKCTPASPIHCVGENGTGTKFCFQNGQGYSSCQIDRCDQGFRLKGNQCVREDDCNIGEWFACTGQNGTGIRACRGDRKFGPCVMKSCAQGYELSGDGESAACKKSRR